MWWLHECESTEPPHVCTERCAKPVRGSWVCSETGAILGPALLCDAVTLPPDAAPASRKRRREVSPRARGRFISSTQQVLRQLLHSDRRTHVEGARADKGRSLALRAANRAVAADEAARRMPNISRALFAAWTVYERNTNAVEQSTPLDAETESHTVRVCADFYCRHMLCETGPVPEGRPTLEALSLATLYFMREGIPGTLPPSPFLAANLPDLARLKSYGFKVNRYTQARRFIQSILDVPA